MNPCTPCIESFGLSPAVAEGLAAALVVAVPVLLTLWRRYVASCGRPDDIAADTRDGTDIPPELFSVTDDDDTGGTP